jgi:tetratricopeptide (TPR) repeat protein
MALLEAARAADPLASPAERERFRRAAWRRFAEARSECNAAHGEREVARAAFSFMHRRMLTGRYEPACARLQATLNDGTYNCLTATYWYIALCRDGGLQAEAVATPHHVAVRLWLDGMACDVETTDPNWSPRPSLEADTSARSLTDAQLLARVHYNLGIEFAEAGQYELALSATRRSRQLDPAHLEAQANLLATLNNWSIALTRAGDYARAEALIREGLTLAPLSEPLRRSDAYLQQQRRAAR